MAISLQHTILVISFIVLFYLLWTGAAVTCRASASAFFSSVGLPMASCEVQESMSSTTLFQIASTSVFQTRSEPRSYATDLEFPEFLLKTAQSLPQHEIKNKKKKNLSFYTFTPADVSCSCVPALSSSRSRSSKAAALVVSPTVLFQPILMDLSFHQEIQDSISPTFHQEHQVIPVCTKICVDLPRSSYPCPALVSVPPTEKTVMSPMAEPKDSSRSSILTNFGGICLDRIRKLADNCVGFQGFLRLCNDLDRIRKLADNSVGFQGFLRLCNDGFNMHFLRMCLMLWEVILRLRNNGFSVLSLALINKLVHLQNMAVFAVNDASIFAGGRIVPDCLLLDVDLVQLPTILPITVLPTVECARMLFDEMSQRDSLVLML